MRRVRNSVVLALFLAIASLCAASNALQGAPSQPGFGLGRDFHLFVRSHPAMGTEFTIYLYAPDEQQASADFQAAFDEIDRIEDALSNYKPSSELSRINRDAASDAGIVTDPEVFDVLQTSLHYSQLSDGAFDVTVGPLMRAWGFFRGQGHYPTDVELAQARASVGWRNVHLDPATRTVHFARKGTDIDLGGIGKGYAVDRVVTLLREAGVASALVDAGSSTLYAIGAPPGESGWPIRVPRPGDRTHALSLVRLRDASLSTSGSYEKFFQLNGHIYCHIMDPRTGRPVQDMLQTSVIAKDATTTDALSTTLFVMGPTAGSHLLASLGGHAIWITGTANAPQVRTWKWTGEMCGIDVCTTHTATATLSEGQKAK
jgi:thiamine biosynthesis lipoprotein